MPSESNEYASRSELTNIREMVQQNATTIGALTVVVDRTEKAVQALLQSRSTNYPLIISVVFLAVAIGGVGAAFVSQRIAPMDRAISSHAQLDAHGPALVAFTDLRATLNSTDAFVRSELRSREEQGDQMERHFHDLLSRVSVLEQLTEGIEQRIDRGTVDRFYGRDGARLEKRIIDHENKVAH